MKPRIRLLLVSMVFLTSTTFLSAISATVGRLSIDSTPQSQVFVDGKPMGKTPKENMKMTPGTHQIGLKKKGAEFQFEFKIKEGRHFRCSHNFETGQTECPEDKSIPGTKTSKKGKLHLTSDPISEVYVDSKKIGPSPVEGYEVVEGHHIVEFRLPNYESVTRNVEVQADQTVTVEAAFPTQKTEE